MWSDFNTANRNAMMKSELYSWPVTLVILTLAFGALAAAGLPVAVRPCRRQPPGPDDSGHSTLAIVGEDAHAGATKEGLTMRILLAVDGSRSSERARDLVAALPWHEDVQVRVASVAPSPTELIGAPWTGLVVPDLERIELEILQSHRDALDLAEREIRSAHAEIGVEAILLRGRAATEIVDEARRMEADLVVVGHRGRGRWESVLLGSVAAEVVDQAPCPVLVARDERLGPVVLADDGSSMARAAEGLLIRWPIFARLPITVVAVAEDGFPYASAVAPLVYSEALEGYAEERSR